MEKFRIYFTPDPGKYNYTLIDSVYRDDVKHWLGGNRYIYSHERTIKGCYYITAVDSAGNESDRNINRVCVDVCGGASDDGYIIPNVFTPNNDGINDYLVATIYGCGCDFKGGTTSCKGGDIITKVDMKIYNRWGKLVFKTEEPCINWDGRDIDSKRLVSPGVYPYVCVVYENRMDGERIVPLVGFITVYSDSGAKPNN